MKITSDAKTFLSDQAQKLGLEEIKDELISVITTIRNYVKNVFAKLTDVFTKKSTDLEMTDLIEEIESDVDFSSTEDESDVEETEGDSEYEESIIQKILAKIETQIQQNTNNL